MTQDKIMTLETPCIVVDLAQMTSNIMRMQEKANQYNCRLRPHIKTHKIPDFAKMQLAHGAVGITSAKISEAEVMAESGIDDIFIAYPQVGTFRLERAIKLAKRVKRLILAVDSIEVALPLNQMAEQAGVCLEVRLEVDTGAKRTGVIRSKALDLAKAIKRLPHLDLTGIYTFKSLIFQEKSTENAEQAALEEGEVMASIAWEMERAGIYLQDISAGSTPTGLAVAKTGLVNEIRPGTYIFNDYMLYKQGIAKLEDIAAKIYATVVSTPAKEYAIIDGGSKTFPTDSLLNYPPYYYSGYGIVENNDDLQLNRLSEEHGIITSKKGDTGLKVGDVLSLIPIHICPAINLQNQIYVDEGECLIQKEVAARGMLV